jgi:hypothetical protein
MFTNAHTAGGCRHHTDEHHISLFYNYLRVSTVHVDDIAGQPGMTGFIALRCLGATAVVDPFSVDTRG